MSNALLPQLTLCEHLAPQQLRLTLFIAPELAYFKGHFPGLPLLPGVVQVDWAVRFAREHLALSGEFSALENLKFQGMVFPGSTLHLALEWQTEMARLIFSYSDAEGGQVYSSGRISFRAEVAA